MRPALVFALLAALAAAPRPARAAAAAAAVATAAALSDCLRATGAEVVEPAAGAAFAAARQVNNARISAWPIAVAYAADATQVATLVRCCAAAGVRAVPRGGGHSYEGLSVQSGAVVVDVSRIDYVEVDAQRRTARVGGGATLGKVYSAVAAASPTLAAVGGVCPSVGVGGHILGGGWGLMSRAFGQACDRVRAVALVDAAGALLEADAERNSDLLWASCGGGGGAFGVVVEFTLALVEVPPVVTLFNGTARGAGPAAAFLDAWQGWQGGADARNTTTVRARVGAATLRGLFLGGAAELKALLAAGALGASAEFEFEREAREMPWIESVATCASSWVSPLWARVCPPPPPPLLSLLPAAASRPPTRPPPRTPAAPAPRRLGRPARRPRARRAALARPRRLQGRLRAHARPDPARGVGRGARVGRLGDRRAPARRVPVFCGDCNRSGRRRRRLADQQDGVRAPRRSPGAQLWRLVAEQRDRGRRRRRGRARAPRRRRLQPLAGRGRVPELRRRGPAGAAGRLLPRQRAAPLPDQGALRSGLALPIRSRRDPAGGVSAPSAAGCVKLRRSVNSSLLGVLLCLIEILSADGGGARTR
jgi:hypothetical protein